MWQSWQNTPYSDHLTSEATITIQDPVAIPAMSVQKAHMLAAIQLPYINPILFEWEFIKIHWYALAYVAGLLFSNWYIKRMAETPRLWGADQPTLDRQQADDFFIWAIIGVVLGGRLGYVLFYKPLYYLANPLEILKTWDGGMSFHGGFLGVVIACMIYGRRNHKSLDRMLDLGAASVPVGLGLGRIANFINVELLGRPSNLPWAVIFDGDSTARHPSQLYEAALEGLILFVAVRIATHSYGALKHPGRASGIFALGYGLSRIIAEFFREPDQHIGYLYGWTTLGMIYSLPLVAVGIWLLLRSRKTQ
jgi:phosphatidylglycerol---prolipoprotein diacylglyceryl transferase